MLIAITADTHLRDPSGLPERCAELAAAADLVVHAGDFTSLAALEAFDRLAKRLIAVHGNVDAPEVVAALPEETTVRVGGVELGIVHDAGPRRGRLARLRRRFPTADAVVFGHSHLPLCEREEDFQIFNPGSPTQRRRAPAHAVGLADAASGSIRFEHVTIS
ncbi:MAG TPA: metallophosphoesterase family protein [Solirubrobacterales bacterium]|nr:metallophosphoesterase family protein [Solirubrobacterales bacterium]